MTSRLDRTFARLRQGGEKVLIAYVMAGDPSLLETEQLVVELEEAGADIIELGVPFSDPIADGVIVGSAIVKQIAAYQQKPGMVKQVAEFVRSMKTAMSAAQPKTS